MPPRQEPDGARTKKGGVLSTAGRFWKSFSKVLFKSKALKSLRKQLVGGEVLRIAFSLAFLPLSSINCTFAAQKGGKSGPRKVQVIKDIGAVQVIPAAKQIQDCFSSTTELGLFFKQI